MKIGIFLWNQIILDQFFVLHTMVTMKISNTHPLVLWGGFYPKNEVCDKIFESTQSYSEFYVGYSGDV